MSENRERRVGFKILQQNEEEMGHKYGTLGRLNDLLFFVTLLYGWLTTELHHKPTSDECTSQQD